MELTQLLSSCADDARTEEDAMIIMQAIRRIKELDARIAELERLTAMSVESLAYIRGIAKKGGGEEVPDSASTHQAILGYVMFMEQQLAAMTAERDSESRWAKKYSDEADELRQQLAAAQERNKELETICRSLGSRVAAAKKIAEEAANE